LTENKQIDLPSLMMELCLIQNSLKSELSLSICKALRKKSMWKQVLC